MSVDISFSSLSDILSPSKLFANDILSSSVSEGSQTMMGAESQVTAQSSSDEGDSSPKSAIQMMADRTILSKCPSQESSCDGIRSNHSTDLSKLEQKRLALRHQRFSLEQRLYEFGSQYSTNSQAFSKKPTRHVLDMAWKDQISGIRVVYSGPVNETDVPHGSGAIMKFSDGQVYQGDVFRGARYGHGKNAWPDGQEYCGEWKTNHRNGKGRHAWAGPEGKRKLVTGEWKDGHLHGKVRFSWPNGASYEGTCYHGKRHGRGVHIWGGKDVGKVYSGSYEKGKEHGFGTLTQPDGVKYRGQWQYGKKVGYGVMLWKTRTYDGEWENDKPNGQGHVVWYNGAQYTGQVADGLYHGVGVYVWPSGIRFVGRWERGIKAGSGFYSWPDGKKYDGEYNNGKKHGFGEFTSSDGTSYRGEWQHDRRHGQGISTGQDGQVLYDGIWKNDEPVEASLAEIDEMEDTEGDDKENMIANVNEGSSRADTGQEAKKVMPFSFNQNKQDPPRAVMGKHLLKDDESVESELLCGSDPKEFFDSVDAESASSAPVTPSPRAKHFCY